MAEAGLSSDEYQAFLARPSQNVDDSGYFSVQVLSAALSVWNLELVPFGSSDSRAAAARASPTDCSAFICHFRDHWFAIRKLGRQWFNLNSILPGPELLSDLYLQVFLAQLQTDRYSIFIVFGQLPDCDADRVLAAAPLSPRQHQRVKPSGAQVADDEDQDGQLRAVLEMSRKELEEEEDQEALNAAILQSLQGASSTALPPPADEDDELSRALRLSLQPDPAVTESVEFIRQRR